MAIMNASRVSKHICLTCRRHLSTARPLRSEEGATSLEQVDGLFTLFEHGIPPSSQQIDYANSFFTTATRQFLKSTPNFRTLPPSHIPEVAFLGRSNVGKSSLLNAVFSKTATKGSTGRDELARTSKRAGKTKHLCAYGVGSIRIMNRGKEGRQRNERGDREFESWSAFGPALVVLDMPGYGAASKEAWGHEIVKYLQSRRQLRRTFILIDSEHELKDTDLSMLRLLEEHAIPHQIVLSKFDKILFPRPQQRSATSLPRLDQSRDTMRRILSLAKEHGGKVLLRDIIGCSSMIAFPKGSGKKLGISELRSTVLQAAGLDSDAVGIQQLAKYLVQDNGRGSAPDVPPLSQALCG